MEWPLTWKKGQRSHPDSNLDAQATAPATGPTVKMEANASRNTTDIPVTALTQPMTGHSATKVWKRRLPAPSSNTFIRLNYLSSASSAANGCLCFYGWSESFSHLRRELLCCLLETWPWYTVTQSPALTETLQCKESRCVTKKGTSKRGLRLSHPTSDSTVKCSPLVFVCSHPQHCLSLKACRLKLSLASSLLTLLKTPLGVALSWPQSTKILKICSVNLEHPLFQN